MSSELLGAFGLSAGVLGADIAADVEAIVLRIAEVARAREALERSRT